MTANLVWKLSKEKITLHEVNFGGAAKISTLFYQLMKPDADVTYQTVNLFSPDECFIYFISDVPHYKHSMKSVQQCLHNSGKCKCTQ